MDSGCLLIKNQSKKVFPSEESIQELEKQWVPGCKKYKLAMRHDKPFPSMQFRGSFYPYFFICIDRMDGKLLFTQKYFCRG